MNKKVNVTVDVREPSELIKEVKEHNDVVNVELDRLEAGDILIRGVGFERKTPSDYASSLTGKSERSLQDQIEKMKQRYDNGYILVEGDYSDMQRLPHTNINPKSLYGSTASTEARHELPVKFCSSMELLVDRAVRIARKHTEEPVSRTLSKGSIVGIDEPFAKMVYGCIDGVGKETAELLYANYPSVTEILDATEGDLRELEGIGQKTAETILQSFYKEE